MKRYARHPAERVTVKLSRTFESMDGRHTLETPFGPMLWRPEIARVECIGLGERCIVQIPRTKASGLCYGCEGRADRQKGSE